MTVGDGGVETLFYRGPITAGDVASWLEPGLLTDGGISGGGTADSNFPNYIFLTDNVVADNSVIGTLIGALSVINNTAGGFTFTKLYDPNNLFQITASNLEVGGDLTGHDGMNPVVIHADNGMDSYSYAYVINVKPP